MHKLHAVTRRQLRDVVAHIDATSSHAKKAAKEYANDYRSVRTYLGYMDPWTRAEMRKPVLDTLGNRDWLAHMGPKMRICDRNGKKCNLAAYRRQILAGARDRWGRMRKRVARSGVVNPPDQIQFLLWYVSHQNPILLPRLIEVGLSMLERWLTKTFPEVPVQIAFHVRTGRAHWEWSAPTYTSKGTPSARGVKWDSPQRSIEHLYTFFKDSSKIPPKAKMNSRFEMELANTLYASFAKLIRQGCVSPPTPAHYKKARKFFGNLQLASLRDGTRSQSPLRRLIASKVLKNKLEQNATDAFEFLKKRSPQRRRLN